jgi:geranylgeranyl diphosphate synthase type II
MDYYNSLRHKFESGLQKWIVDERNSWSGLFKPSIYLLESGGKRLRPVCTLLSYSIHHENLDKVLPAALALELFHNFTLIHDDIMDEAVTRRGIEVVHNKYSTPAAILSGDALLIYCYQLIQKSYSTELASKCIDSFNMMALEVCEGQHQDMLFENRNDVLMREYIEMIKKKTAVLIATSFKMGALIAGGSAENQELLYDFGINLGISFQMQDDYLDAFGSSIHTGKIIGGDILNGKKTALYLAAMENADNKTAENLMKLFSDDSTFSNNSKLSSVLQIFEETGARNRVWKLQQKYHGKALNLLDKLKMSSGHREHFKEILHFAEKRVS